VGSAAEGFLDCPLRPDKEIAASLHRAAEQHRLANHAVHRRQLGPARAEAPRASFSMHQHFLRLVVEHVALHFRYVVGDVVHQAHPELFRALLEDLCESLPDAVHDDLPVGECHVRCAGHRSVVVLAFRDVTEQLKTEKELLKVKKLEFKVNREIVGNNRRAKFNLWLKRAGIPLLY